MDNGCTIVLKPNRGKVEDYIARQFTGKNVTFPIKGGLKKSLKVGGSHEKIHKDLLECGMCADVFSSITEIANHLRHNHHDFQVFDCGICFKFFPFLTELDNHLLESHLQVDTGPVPFLKSSQIDVNEIEKFMKNSDLREKVELKCPLCCCVYSKLAQYQDHMSSSHRGKAWDKEGLCKAVLKVTTIKSASSKPVIRDDPSERGPGKVYTCNNCDKKVFGREPMRRHAATHHLTVIIQCETCSKFYISEEAYRDHMKQKHVSLVQLNVKQNKHGDIIGASLDDILKANDCLSEKVKKPKSPAPREVVEEMTYIDLDSQCIVTQEIVRVARAEDVADRQTTTTATTTTATNAATNTTTAATNTTNTAHATATTTTNTITIADSRSMTVQCDKPRWQTHKRDRSDDSIIDLEHPNYNLLLLSKSAVNEKKKLATEEATSNKREVSDHFRAKWYLSVFHMLASLASLAILTLEARANKTSTNHRF